MTKGKDEGTNAERLASPDHVALIMTGGSRPRLDPDELGGWQTPALHGSVLMARALGVRYLTVSGCSLASCRPGSGLTPELQGLREFSAYSTRSLVSSGTRVQTLGSIDELGTLARQTLDELVSTTARGQRMTLTLAISSGNGSEIIDAARVCAGMVRAGLLLPEEVDERFFRALMGTESLPDVDLLIHSAGARRMGDFLPFETGKAHAIDVSKPWADFRGRDFALAVSRYQRLSPSANASIAPSRIAPSRIAPSRIAPSGIAPSSIAPSSVAPSSIAPSSIASPSVAPSSIASPSVALESIAPSSIASPSVALESVAPSSVAPSSVAPSSIASSSIASPSVALESLASPSVALESPAPPSLPPPRESDVRELSFPFIEEDELTCDEISTVRPRFAAQSGLQS